MALDTTAATAVATAIVGHLGITGPAAAIAIPFWTDIVKDIFDGIVANGIVLPTGIPPLTAGATLVTGTGRIT